MSQINFSPKATKSVVMKFQQERDDALKQIKELKELSNHQGLTTHQRWEKMSNLLNKH